MNKPVTLFFCWLMAAGCASTYDSRSGSYRSTEDYKREYKVEDVCHAASCYDKKSGHMISGEEYNKRQREQAEDQRR